MRSEGYVSRFAPSPERIALLKRIRSGFKCRRRGLVDRRPPLARLSDEPRTVPREILTVKRLPAPVKSENRQALQTPMDAYISKSALLECGGTVARRQRNVDLAIRRAVLLCLKRPRRP